MGYGQEPQTFRMKGVNIASKVQKKSPMNFPPFRKTETCIATTTALGHDSVNKTPHQENENLKIDTAKLEKGGDGPMHFAPNVLK